MRPDAEDKVTLLLGYPLGDIIFDLAGPDMNKAFNHDPLTSLSENGRDGPNT